MKTSNLATSTGFTQLFMDLVVCYHVIFIPSKSDDDNDNATHQSF